MVIDPVSVADVNPKQQLITQWFTDHHSVLFRYLIRLLGDQEHAADVLQETFIRALTALDATAPPNNPFAWLSRIASNLAIDHMRRAKRWRWLVTHWHEPTYSLEAEVATTQAVRLCLARLNPKEAEVLVMTHYTGLSALEIAQLTGDEVSAIRVRLHRARQHFRSLYEKEIA
jgi:RNA polymerase sigma-70 factor, ECF subfamily